MLFKGVAGDESIAVQTLEQRMLKIATCVEDPAMNLVMAMRSDAVESAEREPLAWVAADAAPAAGRPYPADSSTELLRTDRAGAGHLRSVFPRVRDREAGAGA